MKRNPTLLILMLIMLVNALSYGTIIPLLYPYATRFGINPVGLSFLFASFSLAQLIATPIIGRLSDKFGRKPLLLISLLGTSLSLALFASAESALMLFVARIFDGITGGNVSVAQASIADSTKKENRAQAFGMLGAAFGFGFLFGPAIGGLLSTYSLAAPFWFGSGLALIATIAGMFFLHETLPPKKREKQSVSPTSNFNTIVAAFNNPLTSTVLIVSLIFSTSLNAWIIGFNAFSTDILHLSTRNIGLIFASFGFISIVMQAWGIRVLFKRFTQKNSILLYSLIFSFLAIGSLYFVESYIPYLVMIMLYAVVSAPINPLLTSFLSERTHESDQGKIMGINQAIISMGQVIGPLFAGLIAGISINSIFLFSATLIVFCMITVKKLHRSTQKAILQ